MKKNVGSQSIGAQMTTAADGSDFTGAVTVYVTGDSGTQAAGSVGSGACTHEGNGYHSYIPAQAETNYAHIAFTFKATGAISATIQLYTEFPQTVDNGTAIADIQSRLPAALVSGRIDSSVGAMAANVLTAAAINAAAMNGKGDWNIGKTGYSLTQAFPSNFADLSIAVTTGLVNISQTAADKIWGSTTRLLSAGTNIALAKGTGITGFNDLDAAAVATGVWNAATASYGSAGSYGLLVETNLDAAVSTASAPSAATVADAVWDEILSGHAIAGSAGAALAASGAASDPMSTPVPGAYGAGTAGYIIGTNLNATISSRATQTSVDTIDDFVDTEVAAIKTKTDFLPSATAGAAGGLMIAGSNAATTVNITGNITGNVSGSVGSVTAGVTLAASAVQAIWDALTSALTTVGSIGKKLADWTVGTIDTYTGNTKQTGDAYARIGAPAGASVSADVAAVKTETASIQSDTNDIQTRIPAALTGAGNIKADSLAISGSTAAADNLEGHALRTISVTCSAGGSTTTAVLNLVDGAAASSTNDVYNGRILVFSAPAGLKDQACSITAYDGATKIATITAVTAAVGATAAAVMA